MNEYKVFPTHEGLSYYKNKIFTDEQVNVRAKYELIVNILQDCDICEFKTWDGKTYFGLYINGDIVKYQDNGVVCTMRGMEPNIVAIRRPQTVRNAFQCFHDAPVYDYDYTQYGAFDTVYQEQI